MFVSFCSWVAQDYQLLITMWKAQNFQITPDPNGKTMLALISWALLLPHLVWLSLLTQKYYKLWTQKAQQDLTGLLSPNWGKQQSKANQPYNCMWLGTIYYSWKINRFISGQLNQIFVNMCVYETHLIHNYTLIPESKSDSKVTLRM